MVQLTLEDEQVIALIRQLPPEKRRKIIFDLAAEVAREREALRGKTEDRLRQLAAERGLAWDQMNDDQRLSFVDDLVHEDRRCGR